MHKNKEPTSVTLTIHLIKKGLHLEDVVLLSAGMNRRSLQINPEVSAELFIQTRPRKRPSWARFFEGFVSDAEFGWVSSSAALLLVPIDNSLFALTFGQGRYLLAPDSWEDRFGLVVALNSIPPGEFRSIDKKILDAISRRTREQAGRAAAVQEFGVDIERDLLKAVTGKPTDRKIGEIITGGDALNVHVKTTLNHLPQLLERYRAKSRQRSYRKDYPWIDQISAITNKELTRKLDAELLVILRQRRVEHCWLAPPAVIDWGRNQGFAYGSGIKQPIRTDIHLDTFLGFLESLKTLDEIDQSDLVRRRVVVIGENDQPRDHWSVYRCMNCELEYQGDNYVLSDGKWYKVATSFVAQIDQYYARIQRFETTLPEYEGGDEKEYNKNVCRSTDQYANLDRDLIQIEGGRDKIEFCDLLSSSKDFIHVKRYSGSGVLSHLFNQGLVSGEYFQMDEDFRRIVNKKLPDTFRLLDPSNQPQRLEYRIVFAIISQSEGDLRLPFFSRVSLRHVVRRLEGFGYRVALAKIALSETARKLKKVRRRKAK
jgi:uncharacterized protein (TIGR04141 family)